MSIFEQRRNNLVSAMLQHDIHTCIFTPSTDYRYLTGSRRQPAQRVTALILSASRCALVLPDFEIKNETTLAKNIELIPYSDSDDPILIISHLLPQNSMIAAGREMRADFLLALQQQASSLHWCCADSILAPLRRKKDAEEIQTIEAAQHMAETALGKLLKEPLVGQTEQQIASRLMELRLQEGFESVGCGIVASGPNTASPHHVNGQRILQEGDVLMFDIGGLYNGYRADFTRTFAVGFMPQGFSEIYQIVLEAPMAGKTAAHAGVPAKEVDFAARQVIEKAGYGPYFTHRLGHGIGLEVHEPPFIGSSNNLQLEYGNVFSCEPGIYLPGRFGVRIEDLLVLEETGVRSLNTLSKELTIL